MRVLCVVDDAVQRSSSFWGEHGLAFLIETGGRCMVFDTGQSGTVLLHNLELLDVDPAAIDAVAVSHAHYDHTGGLPALLEHVRPGTPLYANLNLFRERLSRREGEPQAVALSVTREALAARLKLCLNAAPQEILPRVWTTDDITERPEPEGSSDYHLMREADGLGADAYRDDMALVLQTGDVVSAMRALRRVYPNHCTGEAAFVALMQILRCHAVRPRPAGTVLDVQYGYRKAVVAVLVGGPLGSDL